MSVTHPSGSDLESMNEFYDKKILRAVTLIQVKIRTRHVKLPGAPVGLARDVCKITSPPTGLLNLEGFEYKALLLSPSTRMLPVMLTQDRQIPAAFTSLGLTIQWMSASAALL